MGFFTSGLLGMNRRNAVYLLKHNRRKLYPLVDDKLKTKQLLASNGIPTPELFFTIRYEFETRRLRTMSHLNEFVIKPARGAEGRGILVITGREGNTFIKASGERLSIGAIEYHISNIHAGLYSLGGNRDQAFVESFVHSHSFFATLAYRGVPDIRVILYRGIPVIGMLRLPTKISDGRANLHQGAIGVGIAMQEGITLNAVFRNKIVTQHPDTHAEVAGLRLPYWESILETSVRLYDLFKLGYIGVDFVIDQERGPLILELNARPGLNIQLANGTGILPRLQAIDRLGAHVEDFSAQKRLEIFRSVRY